MPLPSFRGSRVDRRRFLELAMGTGFACALGGGLRGMTPWVGPRRGQARAEGLILIDLRGGLSHLDSFDPKPGAAVEIRGELGTVSSAIDGELFSARLQETARIADRLCVIRSMTHGEAAHERGSHSMLTGYPPSPAIVYPSMGSVIAHELGGRHKLPPYVCVPRAADDYAGTGYLPSACAPFSVAGDPSRAGFRVRDVDAPKEIVGERLASRRSILRELDERFAAEAASDDVEALEAFYRQAFELVDSPEARSAFDIEKEPAKLRDRYGRTSMGQKFLFARRLVSSGVRQVTVFDDGWDHHRNLGRSIRAKLGEFDRAFAALIRDLEEQELLDRILVMVVTEFGRTPRMNRDQGRDHWPRVFSVVVAGAGIKRGIIHGASDSEGAEPDRDAVRPADLYATAYTLLGIDPEKKLMSPGDRPIDIVRDGAVVREILA